jgi:dihydroorotate dehydrogenase (NAD+) catalytic subunit
MPDFCGIPLTHPVINASGTYDAITARRVFGDSLLQDFPFSAFVSKTITPEARTGNGPRRIWETPAGMINSIGLPNKGLEGFLGEDLPQLAELPVPLIVSVMATNSEDFSRLVTAVAAREEVAAIELNVSCPNVHSGLIVGEQPAETEALSVWVESPAERTRRNSSRSEPPWWRSEPRVSATPERVRESQMSWKLSCMRRPRACRR